MKKTFNLAQWIPATLILIGFIAATSVYAYQIRESQNEIERHRCTIEQLQNDITTIKADLSWIKDMIRDIKK